MDTMSLEELDQAVSSLATGARMLSNGSDSSRRQALPYIQSAARALPDVEVKTQAPQMDWSKARASLLGTAFAAASLAEWCRGTHDTLSPSELQAFALNVARVEAWASGVELQIEEAA